MSDGNALIGHGATRLLRRFVSRSVSLKSFARWPTIIRKRQPDAIEATDGRGAPRVPRPSETGLRPRLPVDQTPGLSTQTPRPSWLLTIFALNKVKRAQRTFFSNKFSPSEVAP